MTVNLQFLGTLLGKVIKILGGKFFDNFNINGNNKTNSDNTTININKTVIVNENKNITVTIKETTDMSTIKELWPSIVKDIQIHKEDSSYEFWMHADLKCTSSSIYPIINIGKYYTATVDTDPSKTVTFWIGAEASLTPKEKIEYSVYLFITKELLKKQKLNSGKICEIDPDVNGAYVIKIDEFSNGENSDIKLKDILEKKLQAFLTNIFYQDKM